MAKVAGVATVTGVIAGCGAGGVLSEGITGLSSTGVALDAGQTYTFDAQVLGTPNVSWTLSGTDCVGASCGELSSTTGGSVRYTAPTTVAKPQNVVLKATIANTQAMGTTATISLRPQLSLTGTALPSTTQGAMYSTALTTVGGMAPFQWSVAHGSLPAGMSLDAATGRISGTSLATGSFAFSVAVTDASASNATSQASYTLAVVAPSAALAVATNSLPGGTTGTVYSAQLQALGGTLPYSFSVAGGSLPAGLALAPNGVLAGTPVAAGTNSVTVRVADAAGITASATLPVSILPSALALLSTALPNASVGTNYASPLAIAGGTAPYTCSTAAGSLPAGLSLTGCTITGTAMATGIGNVTVRVKDAGSPSSLAVGAVNLNVLGAPLTITTTTLPQATLGLSYSASISSSGGTAPYSCAITGGTLPTGLSLNSCTISGRLTGASGNAFTIQVKDAASPANAVSGSFKIQQAAASLTLLGNALANGSAGVSYSTKISALGGISPYVCSIAGGALPAGLALNNCTVSGVPASAGSGSVTFRVTDAQSPAAVAGGTMTWTIAPAGLVLATKTLPNATVDTPYAAALSVTGGVAPYRCSVTSGSLPAGVLLAGCALGGTPSAAGTAAISIGVSDAATPTHTATGSLVLAVSPAVLSITTATLAPGKTGSTYTSPIAVMGGKAPFACAVTGGALPAGLTMKSCVVSGTPTKTNLGKVTITATDAGAPMQTANAAISWSVGAADLTMSTTALPTQAVGSTYATALDVAGGTGTYACSLSGGALPAGLALTGCSITGRASQGGNGFATIKVADTSSPQETLNGRVSWTVTSSSLALSATSLPQTMVGKRYTVKVPISGGAPPYTCSVTGGQLAEGLALQGCTVVGTPTQQGMTTFNVHVADTSSQAVSGSINLVVKPSPSVASALVVTTTSLPNGTAAVFYSSTIAVAGGKAPYTCAVTGGALPTGLSVTGCSVTGTPTGAAAAMFTIRATDAGSPAQFANGSISVGIAPAVLTLAGASMPPGVAGQQYAGSMTATGGTAPYRYSLASGALPAGLVLGADGVISGSPAAAGTATFTAQVTDAGSPQITASHPFSITVAAPALTLNSASLPRASAGRGYSALIGVSGGAAPYGCGLVSGALPAGLILSGCKVSGTPTAIGDATITVKATDASTPVQTASAALTVSVSGSPMTITTSVLPNATKNVAYSSVISTTGGTGAVTCAVSGGSLPAGLQLDGTACSIGGTPTAAGTASVNIVATDSTKPNANTVAATLPLTVNGAALSLSATQPANPVLGQPYSQTLTATGGQAPYSFSIASGALPRGLAMSAGGVITGIPTAAGASSLVVLATDSAASAETASQAYMPLVIYPVGTNNAQLSGSYAFLMQGFDSATGGDLAYQTATVGSFSADGAGLVKSGEMDSNHQGPDQDAGAPSHLIGTYEVGSDDRGLITLTIVKADGTTGASSTFAIAATAEIAADGSASVTDIVAAGGEPMLASGAPGMLLAQDKTAFAKALKGNYVFGAKGDTPCLKTCVNGIVGGPAAAVGQFTADGSGDITGGTGDSAVATTNYTSAGLSGSYGAADSNGRTALTLKTAGTPAGVYPGAYAVYIVDANQAVLMSTDSHATHVLLSGTAQLQTQSSFANSSISGAFLGAVNATADPSSLQVPLSSVSSAGTATIFRGTATADGNCSVTNVDIAGDTQLTAAVTGAGSSADGITALLGARAATGAATCGVATNGRGVLSAPSPSAAISSVLSSLGLAGIAEAPRVFYLAGPDRGYFLETGYAALGSFEPQTGTPVAKASLSGSYEFGTGTASSAASDSASGVLLSNGAGSATITLDTGLDGSGQITTGTSRTVAYSLTDTAAGRIDVNGIVLYALSPDRFLRLDRSATTVSPSVGTLQR